MGLDYRWDDPDSVTRIIQNRPLQYAPNMRTFHLNEATNLTDVISQGYIYTMGLLVSEAWYEALAGYVAQAHEVYPAEVAFRGNAFSYKWLHIVEEIEGLVNYVNSRFVVRRRPNSEESLPIPSLEGLRSRRLELVNTMGGSLLARQLSFLPGTPHYDLFCLRLTGFVFYVSDRLAEEFLRRRLTGFDVGPPEIPVVFE
jgi:hypothetical protein